MRTVVLAPTHNNADTLIEILERVVATGLPVIVINDGSTDDTAAELARWERARPGGEDAPRRMVVTHARNRGKAAALRTGFSQAGEAGYTHAATIDTDGQHDPEQLPGLVSTAETNPHALVLGIRRPDLANAPRRSLVGRSLSNLGIRLACGLKVIDSQCGLRVYPLGLIEAVGCRSQRYAFETEIITRAVWASCPVMQVPVTSRYARRDERVSHFRPVVDSLRCLWLHGRLLARSLMPWPHRVRWPERSASESDRDGRRRRGWRERVRRGLRWLNPVQCWREVRSGEAGRLSTATGLGIGAFIANLPTYGLHTVMALYVARRLHLHPLSVVGGTQLSCPPLAPFLIAAGIGVGHLLLHGSLPAISEYDPWQADEMTLLGRVLLEWSVGSIVVGLFSMIAVTAAALGVFWLLPDPDDDGAASKASSVEASAGEGDLEANV